MKKYNSQANNTIRENIKEIDDIKKIDSFTLIQREYNRKIGKNKFFY